MSVQNFELARRLFAAASQAINRGEFEELDGLIDPEIEWIPINATLEGGEYRGAEGVRRWVKETNHDWDFFEARPEEFRDLGGDRVLCLGTWGARGRGSGVELTSQPAAWLVDLRAGKAVRMQTFTDRDKALAAAGLRE
jgi:ketosteroid isomerase-like protein